MAAAAKTSIRTAIYSTLGGSAGNAIYRWRVHGTVDWIGVLEFALGWGVGTVAILSIERWWRNRAQRKEIGSLAEQD
jgi:hypothetical protein